MLTNPPARNRFFGMLLFLACFCAFLVGLAWLTYWVDAGLARLFSRWGVPDYGAALGNVVMLMVVVLMVLASGLTVGERKWSAMIQNRIGPNRIRVGIGRFSTPLGGMPFLVADALKMLTKEDIRPSQRSHALFLLAPIIAFAPAFVLFAVVPVGPPVLASFGDYTHRVALQVASIDAGILFVFGAASIAVYGTALAAWASNNKLAILGGVRATSQMISYEVSLGLSLAGAMMAYGSLRLEDMVAGQGRLLFGWLPALGIFLQPVGLLVFFVSAFAETKRAPFDLPEGESEIVGYFVEYPGMKFGMMFLGEFIEVVVLAAITSAIFLGGWHPILFEQTLREAVSPIWFASICAAVFLLKVLVLCWVQLVIRWTLPRFRFDQVQHLCWKGLLPVTLVNVFLTGALVLADASLEWLAVVGLLELAAMAIVTVAAARRAAPLPGAGAHGGGHGHAAAPAPAAAGH